MAIHNKEVSLWECSRDEAEKYVARLIKEEERNLLVVKSSINRFKTVLAMVKALPEGVYEQDEDLRHKVNDEVFEAWHDITDIEYKRTE